VTLVAARRLNAPYCVLAHTAVLRDWLDDRQMLDAIVADPHYAGLDPAEVAIMDFVERLLVDPAAASEADAEALPRHEPSTPQR
jgi:alkylhydroperoxidase family enzyme